MAATGCVSVTISDRGGIGIDPGVTGTGNPETFTFNVGEIIELRTGMLVNIEHYGESLKFYG